MQNEGLLSETVFGEISDGVLVYASNGDVTYLNPAFEKFFADYGVSCAIGINQTDLEKSARLAGIPKLPNSDKGTPECNFTHPSGRHILLRSHRLAAGKKALTMTDITSASYVKDLYSAIQPKTIQAASESYAQSPSPMNKSASVLADINHEIRTPLNSVLGMAQLLKTKNLGELENSFVETIETSGEALLKIVENVFDHSKLGSKKLSLTPETFSIHALVKSVFEMFHTQAEAKNIGLHLRLSPGLPALLIGDANRIKQILSNLVNNAVKFTDTGQIWLNVSGTRQAGELQLSIDVTDTGIGIPDDQLEMVFTEFCCSVSSGSYLRQGTGLGLSISRGLAKMMGGSISVQSELGVGSTFNLELALPIECEHAAPRPNSQNIDGLNILIIDNRRTNREMIKQQVSLGGANPIAAATAAEGIEILSKANKKDMQIDAVIIDFHLPYVTGAECARQIKADPALSALPVVMITSIDDPVHYKHVKKQGAACCLLKPVSSKRLCAAIGTATAPEDHEVIALPVQNQIDVLIAEDNAVNQLYIEHVMKKIGLRYKIVANGKLAVEEWTRLSPRIILMDISMPELDGIEATKAIRELEQIGNRGRTPIIAVTAHAHGSDERRVRAEGMDDYLSKPLSIMRLQRKLSDWGIMPTYDKIATNG